MTVLLTDFADDGARKLILRITEADGTLHHFPLDAKSAAGSENKLLEKSDLAD